MWNYLKKFFVLIKPENCLVRKINPEKLEDAFELEELEMYGKPSNSKTIDPFYREKVLIPFMSKLKPGDELWFYRFPPEYWRRLRGSQGYVILRNGKRIDYIESFMN